MHFGFFFGTLPGGVLVFQSGGCLVQRGGVYILRGGLLVHLGRGGGVGTNWEGHILRVGTFGGVFCCIPPSVVCFCQCVQGLWQCGP